MTETQERFLRTVLTRVPLDTVVEMHLFPPLRRGTLETGVAVIATELPGAHLSMIELEIAPIVAVEDTALTNVALDGIDSDDRPAHDPLADAAAVAATVATLEEGDDVEELLTGEVHDEGDLEPADAVTGAPERLMAVAPAADADLDERPVAADNVLDEDVGAADAELVEEIAVVFEGARVLSRRLRILTASYRHTIKGVERGKWTVDVQEEADAPLEAVELVLRGVRHRSTEPADPELVSHDALAALLTPTAVAPAA